MSAVPVKADEVIKKFEYNVGICLRSAGRMVHWALEGAQESPFFRSADELIDRPSPN